ncbi:phospho-N-acetylmuramoyl-pentapeptide-transferase [Neofamilia massiliensis]|uniref:phospho-N-acetylmuramoyl-pentapeptide- transferase n=1 Tax=Neofamilia massiliensis TaxID=1673724 RepID=UPI0006BB8FF4|nr:phospho-N-acetylmuramoyl-pentapeptide-transferase [Neofamilia massiliensis]
MTKYYIENFVIAAIISLVLGPIIIPELKKLKIGQAIREDGPQSHLIKTGTPTMGGIIFIVSTLITILVFGVNDKEAILCTFSMLSFGLIGLIDDYLIVVKKTNDGLSASQKFSAQVLVALVLMFLSTKINELGNLYIPFLGRETVNLGIFYYPITLFVILGTVNSVNLTDGLDGLAASVSMVGLVGFAVINVILSKNYLSMFAMALAGSLLGYLRYNKFPAQVFMGDVGSLALGGAFAAIAVVSGTTLYLPIIGLIFVVETLSVIIQVASFKLRGKRVFLMSPIHHHYEAKGWSEVKIVKVFFAITLITTVISILAIR